MRKVKAADVASRQRLTPSGPRPKSATDKTAAEHARRGGGASCPITARQNRAAAAAAAVQMQTLEEDTGAVVCQQAHEATFPTSEPSCKMLATPNETRQGRELSTSSLGIACWRLCVLGPFAGFDIKGGKKASRWPAFLRGCRYPARKWPL